MRVDLDGEWRLYTWPEGSVHIDHPDDLAKAPAQPVTALVPGNVEIDLERAGLLADPFYAENSRRLRPLEINEWWYVRDIELPPDAAGQPWDLVCSGLDTLATVWVNGVEVGRAQNMMLEHRFDVGQALKPGASNRIAVRLASPLNYARRFHYDAATLSWEHREEGVYIRKAPHMWGWDIMPRMVSAGIWRSIWLETRPAAVIEQIYYWTDKVYAEGATLGVRFQFRLPGPSLDNLQLSFHGECGDHCFDSLCPVEFIAGGWKLEIPGARLWWPKGYGEPNLYTVTVRLCRGDDVLAERTDRVGIRKLVVHRTEVGGAQWLPVTLTQTGTRLDTPPSPSSHFYITVNDTPIMVKGANWVPLDALHSRDAQRVDQAVALFDELGCTMIRCWGGNVYEDQHFFDLCDEKGMMVWQDLAYACCRYPQTDDFLAQVRAEIEQVSEKLRNHPSLALYCGDNEIDMAYATEGLAPHFNRLTREVIPHTLHRCDPYRDYVPSSPYVPPVLEGTDDAWRKTPEQHLWGPRGYYKGHFYTGHTAHFIGEIGYHGCNNVSSIKRFISPDKLWPWQNNDEWQMHAVYHWQQHVRDRDRIQLMANQVRELFGEIPTDLETFALASQIVQAEAKKFFIESTRLRKWHTSGILWWNVIDGWPQFSDAIVDYYFAKKLAYQYIRRSQQPLCVMIGEAGAGLFLPVVLCNDTRQDHSVHLQVTDADSGEALLEETLLVPANQNLLAGRLRTFASDQRLYVLKWETGGQTFASHYLAGTPPFSLQRYLGWLKVIAALPPVFDASVVAK